MGDDGGTWIVKATGKKAIPPGSQYQPKRLDRASASAAVATMRDAQRNEELGAVAFLHTVAVPSGNTSRLDGAALDGKPGQVVIVSALAAAVTNDHAVGVYYDGSKWAVYNEDGASMPAGAAFSVRAMAPSANAFVHATTMKNVSGHITYIDDAPLVNGASVLAGQAYAALQVTHLWNAPGLQGIYNNHPVGVWYDGARWAIYNEDFAPMPVGTAFAVKLGGYAVVTSNLDTRAGSALLIDDPSMNGLPGAHVFFTHNWSPPGAPSAYTTKHAALRYDAQRAKWSIVNFDGSAIADGVSFNVHRGY